MPNHFFKFKQFTINQDKTAMKVGSDSVILGSWTYIDDSVKQILDIGTGTGLLALMMAQRCPAAYVTAVEIDGQSGRQASENVTNSPWNDRITVINCDIKQFKSDKKFDLIITNPPYFHKSLKSADEKRNLARHNDGLLLPDLIEVAHNLLSDNGYLSIIIPKENELIINGICEAKNMYTVRRLLIKPTELKPANRVILEISKKQIENIKTETLIVRDNYGNYTEIYKSLTKNFYLNL